MFFLQIILCVQNQIDIEMTPYDNVLPPYFSNATSSATSINLELRDMVSLLLSKEPVMASQEHSIDFLLLHCKDGAATHSLLASPDTEAANSVSAYPSFVCILELLWFSFECSDFGLKLVSFGWRVLFLDIEG